MKDFQWKIIYQILPNKIKCHSNEACDRRFIEGVIWMLKKNVPWKDLPEKFGKSNSVRKRFNRWCEYGIWEKVFNELSKDKKPKYLIIDSTISRAHHQTCVKRELQNKEGLGRSRGGFSTKIHLTTNENGLPLRVIISPGQDSDHNFAEKLISGLIGECVIADRGYDSDCFICYIQSSGLEPVIPPKANRKVQRFYDAAKYTSRNLIERAFNKLKHNRRLALRVDRFASSFLAFLFLASSLLWLNSIVPAT